MNNTARRSPDSALAAKTLTLCSADFMRILMDAATDVHVDASLHWSMISRSNLQQLAVQKKGTAEGLPRI